MLFFAAACGGDSEPSADTSVADPTSTAESSEGTAPDPTATVESSETASPLTLVTIAGHAEGDESIAIVIEFDPRDTGLTLTVKGAGDSPSWAAINEGFVVRVGAISISGEGSFQGADGSGTAEGSFEASCR